ncbi:MAG TPA: sulfotransferase [Rhizomicrobium sp.]|nr:sulfotransferase [Rhizomicrobium sp.]
MASNVTSGGALEQQYLRALATAVQAKDFERAFGIADEALAKGVEHPRLLGLAAQRRLRSGDAAGAYPILVRARELDGRNADILNDLGLCMMQTGRARESLGVLDAALRQAPGSARFYFNKALAYEILGELDSERRALERVVAIDADHIPALNLLALLAADRNDAEAAHGYANRALALSPNEVMARLALATVEIGARDFSAARRNLEPLLNSPMLDPENRAQAQTLMGDALDGEADYAAAFRFYSEAKEALRAHYARAFTTRTDEPALARLARLRAYFSMASGNGWRGAETRRRAPVFLTGFLRSGTTLLGQILAGHSDVEVMHERDCLVDTTNDFIVPPGGLDRLATLDDAAIQSYAERYWTRARQYSQELRRGMFVDKAPTLTPLLPLVAKLFPNAKVLFIVRDPRDVVLSCFRRRFAMSAEKFDMLALADVAAAYAATMELAELYKGKLDLDVLEVRYESITADFDVEVRRVCDFLGLEYQPAMADFGARVKTSNIDTPNIAQLARGLSRESEGHWRHYRKELMPILPTLAPWCERFGYPED